MSQGDLVAACDPQPQPMVLTVVPSGNTPESLINARFEINDHHCIVGSDSHATLAIEKAGLKSLHCEIVRNPAGTYVRQLAEELRVNDQPLREAWLHPGDQIQLGNLCVRIDELGVVTPPQSESFAEQLQSDPNVPTMIAVEQSVEREPYESAMSTPEKHPTETTSDAYQLESELEFGAPSPSHADQPEPGHVATEQPIENSSSDPQPSGHPPEELMPGWDNDSQQDEHAKWLDDLYQQAMSEDESSCASTPTIEEGWDSNQPTQRDLHEDSSWLQSDQYQVSELMRAGNDPQQISDVPNPTREETEKVFEQIESSFEDSDQVQLTTESPTDDEANVEMEVTPTETPTSPPNESVADVLARMKESGQISQPLPFEVDEQRNPAGVESPKPVHSSTDELAGENPRTETESAGADDDSSVQDYMSQLFERLRGEQSAPAAKPVPTQVDTYREIERADNAREPKPSEQQEFQPANPLRPSEYRPKQSAPEKTTTLNALRQVANQSVKSAIQVSTKQKNLNASLIYLGGTGIAFFISTVLFIMSQRWFDLCFIFAICAAVFCAVLGYMFVQINIDRRAIGQNKNSAPADSADEPTEPQAIQPPATEESASSLKD